MIRCMPNQQKCYSIAVERTFQKHLHFSGKNWYLFRLALYSLTETLPVLLSSIYPNLISDHQPAAKLAPRAARAALTPRKTNKLSTGRDVCGRWSKFYFLHAIASAKECAFWKLEDCVRHFLFSFTLCTFVKCWHRPQKIYTYIYFVCVY